MFFKYSKQIGSVLIAILVAGCGDGDNRSEPDLQITSASVQYSKKMIVTITGADLEQVNTASITKCSGLSLEPTSTSTQRNISCTVSGTGELSVELKDDAGIVLASKTFKVPEPRVKMSTSLGDIIVELNPTAAPVTVNNFLRYVSSGFYSDTLFHRVTGFVAQGGWLTTEPAIKAGTLAPISLESNNGLSNVRGSIGMVRTTEANSATSQYYFNLLDNPGLNYVSDAQPGYAAFGMVVEGLNVLDAIGSVPIESKYGLSNVPVDNLILLSAEQVQ
jgi:peptidyl-prolyl cis-trans isomerase A (cyclophilin A)